MFNHINIIIYFKIITKQAAIHLKIQTSISYSQCEVKYNEVEIPLILFYIIHLSEFIGRINFWNLLKLAYSYDLNLIFINKKKITINNVKHDSSLYINIMQLNKNNYRYEWIIWAFRM